MSTTAPQTPENTPRRVALNRSFTLPSKITAAGRTNTAAEIGSAEGIETLYVHPNGKIVKFSCAPGSRIPPGAHSPGRLPWATLSEQTLASGNLEIYRVPGSVSFLHSGSLLHAILPRSNCWCVDGVSKFAMRVLADTYYRIELPGETPEDLERVEEFKATLKKVLFYERTACPFARTFTVDLPEEPQVRRKQKRYHGPAKRWKLEKAYSWRPEDGGEPPRRDSEASSGSASPSDDEDASSADEHSDASEVADQVRELNVSQTPSRPSVRERAAGFNRRSVTAPPQLSLQSTPPSRLRTSMAANRPADVRRDRSHSPEQAPSVLVPGTLRPFQAIPTDMPPSPPDSSAGLEFIEPVSRDPSHAAEIRQELHTPSKSPSVVSPALPGSVAAEPNRSSPLCSDQVDHSLRGSLVPQPESEEVMARAIVSEPGNTLDEQVYDTLSQIDHGDHELPRSSRDESGADSVSVSLPETEDVSDITNPADQPSLENGEIGQDEAVLAADPDPFAQIQARIQARRSIGGTISFHPGSKSPTRQSSSSNVSSASTRSGLSRRSQASQQHQQAFATALVKKACSVFLGPPAHLAVIMLRIAARFAKGAFPSALLFESPAGMAKRIPGSFDLDGSDVEEFGLDLGDLDWEEDDFGVPLRSPVRLATRNESIMSRTTSTEVASEGVRERAGYGHESKR